ncbi:g1859 [Coccomyxa elongata]
MRYHPDVSTAPDAAEKFEQVRKAADQILNRSRATPQSVSAAAAEASAMSRRWERMSRHPSFAMWFSAACLLGGCLIFAGALHVHQDLYTYNIHKEMEERRKNPTAAQRRILDLLVEKRVEVAAEKRDQHPPR